MLVPRDMSVQVTNKGSGATSPSAGDDLLDNAPVPMSCIAPDGTILWANRRELELLGYTAEEYVGRRLEEIHLDQPTAPALLEALRSGRGTRDQPARLRRRDGGAVHVLVNLTARDDGDGPVYGRCAMRDITDRVQVAQERARILEEALATDGSSSVTTDGYLHFAPDWTITFAQLNAGPERSAAIRGKSLWDVYPDVRGSPFEAHYREAMADRKPRTFRAYYAPQGLWLENRLFPAGDGLALYYRDVGWHHDLERQLKQRSRQQSSLADLGHAALRGEPIAQLTEQACEAVQKTLGFELVGVVERAGDGTLRIAAAKGFPPGTAGRTVPPEHGGQTLYTLQQGAPVVVTDLVHETRFRPSPILLEQGVVNGVCVPLAGVDGAQGVLGAHSRTARAITADDVHFMENVANLLASAMERARSERELRAHRDNLEGLVAKRTALLERSNREMEAFNYTVSHDLRAPLRGIGGFASLLQHRHARALPAEAQELVGRIADSARRMGQLIDSLLALARLQGVAVRRSEVDVSSLAAAVVDELRQAEARDVAVEIAPGLRADADPDLVRALLVNLLGNAWKFTRGVPSARITVAPAATPPGVRGPAFAVADNGVGFDQALATRLFEPFQRLHDGQAFEGTGIGLATVRRIAERHDGTVWAEAAPGRGATFCFSLPAAAP